MDLFALREKLIQHLPVTRAFTNLPLVSLDSTIGVTNRKKVVNAFLSTSEYFKDTFSRAINESDLQELQRLGHRFKGASQTVGGSEFNNYCQILENVESIEIAGKMKNAIVTSLDSLQRCLAHYA